VTLADLRGEDRRASAARDRVRRAYGFLRPDRIPRFDNFWDYPEEWRALLGEPEELSDIEIWAPSEGAFCTGERLVKDGGDERIRVDAWGATTRERAGAYFAETLEVAIPAGTDPDSVQFDPPWLDARFGQGRDARGASRYVFGKTGGPYLRTTFVRGEAQFLLDIASDAHLALALADKMADHLAAVGVEAIRRWNLQETGMSIWDDMAGNHAPMFSPDQFERIFLPGYRRMIKAYRDAGAPHVFLHSDGNILPLLEMLVDAGIDGLNPLERRAGMDPVLLRTRFPKLVLIGGMDNTDTLINGPVQKIEAEARALIDMGGDGGLIIGTHSVSPEIPLENFAAYHRCCRTYGAWPRG
jgi:hypothetical protein